MKKFISKLKGQKLGIKCTWANAMAYPQWNRGYCIRSFDRKLLRDLDVENTIGFATGNMFTDKADVTWIEAELLYTDRMPVGWFRENDVDFDLQDTDYKKESSWLKWLTAGFAALQFIR
ncbi:MAG: hypothetical protein BGO29_04595 [Bacteroidales bacterium 36-12]|mgnify:CR=1 FL=1|nr:MAG: hypothetical protein BGO29_04595 [Bacteroidales bacterium 36-12]